MAATRPLITAEPMFRAPRPEMVSESNFASCACAAVSKISEPVKDSVTAIRQRIDLCMIVGVLIDHLNRQHFLTFQVNLRIFVRMNQFPADGFFVSDFAAGIANRASFKSTFCSIFSTENCCREELPFCS